MTWLNAALAFALSMLLFATIVSMIVESIHRMFRMRREGLEWMLERVYAEVVARRPDLLPGPNDVADFIRTLTCNDTLPAQLQQQPQWWKRLITPHQLNSLTTLDFAERLAGTDIGQQLKRLAADERQQLINGLVQKFEYYGKGAGVYFSHRAKALSVTAAVIFAFAANIDAIHLANAFLTSPQLTERLIAQAPTFETDLRVQSVKLEHALADASMTPEEKSNHLKDIQQQIAAANSSLSALIAQGLPIGWDYYPPCRAAAQDARCTNPTWLTAIAWFLSTLLAGFLIGLGGPFWFSLCSNMTTMARVGRDERTDGQAAAAAKGGPTKAETPDGAFAAAILLETAGRAAPEDQHRSRERQSIT